ncbi:hypothetical protein Tco_0272233 [Tanacetum coccineum]
MTKKIHGEHAMISYIQKQKRTTNTPMETNKALTKDEDGEDVDIHLYRSMIESLMYLTSSRLDIIYLNGRPKLGLWYPKDSPFILKAFSDSDYAGASLDRKSTIGDLLTKAFDVTRFQFLIASIGLELQDKKELAIPGQTTTGKEFSNPLMAGSLPKTIILEHCYFQNNQFCEQIHAIVDGKVVVISESSVRSDLLFNDEDGVTCLTNDEIFENLALMGYEQLSTKLTFQKGSFSPQWKFLIHTILHCISSKSTAWNEFSTNLASAVICLAKGQKFNFSKLIFNGMLRNLDSKKFLMYPRFLQLFLNNQLKDLPEPFNDTYVTPCHTKKVFSNMARKSVNFSGNITLLFASMLVQNQAPDGEGSPTRSERVLAHPNEPPLSEGHTSGSGEGRMEHTFELTDNVPSTPYDSPIPGGYTPRSDEGRMTQDELITLCIKLSKQVLDLEKEKDAQAVEILNLKKRVKRSERKRKSSISHPRRRKYRQVETSSDDDLDEEDASKQGRRSDKLKPMFKDKDFEELDDHIKNVEEDTVDAAATRVSTVRALVSTADSQKKADSTNKPAGGSRKKTLARKRAGEKKSEESAKKQKLEDVAEEQESAKSDDEVAADYEHEKEELRMWLSVVSDEEETVYPKNLSAKYPIVDWESQNLGNVDMEDLHVYKIIRADGNTSYHKSLSSMLRKFNRQDLVDLHRLVMKRFEDTTPEGYNLLLWGDLKVMFEPNAEDEIWSNQQDWTLISWKLYESCGVHTLLMDGTLTSFNMLVEKRYPLIKEMLQKMLNWKLEAEAESTMAFELLKFIKSQLEE